MSWSIETGIYFAKKIAEQNLTSQEEKFYFCLGEIVRAIESMKKAKLKRFCLLKLTIKSRTNAYSNREKVSQYKENLLIVHECCEVIVQRFGFIPQVKTIWDLQQIYLGKLLDDSKNIAFQRGEKVQWLVNGLGKQNLGLTGENTARWVRRNLKKAPEKYKEYICSGGSLLLFERSFEERCFYISSKYRAKFGDWHKEMTKEKAATRERKRRLSEIDTPTQQSWFASLLAANTD